MRALCFSYYHSAPSGRRGLSAQLAFAAQEGAVAVDGYHHEADEGQDERHVDGGHAQQFHLVDDGGLERGQHATTEDGHDETGGSKLGVVAQAGEGYARKWWGT